MTTQKPSDEAVKAAEVIAAGLTDMTYRRELVANIAETIDSHFSTLIKERDELREALSDCLTTAQSLYSLHYGKTAKGGTFDRAAKALRK